MSRTNMVSSNSILVRECHDHVCSNLEQASQRGGKFVVRVDEETGRCYLQGGAILVMAGVAGIR